MFHQLALSVVLYSLFQLGETGHNSHHLLQRKKCRSFVVFSLYKVKLYEMKIYIFKC